MPDATRRAAGRLVVVVALSMLGVVSVASANPCALPENSSGALAAVDLSGVGGSGDSGIGGTGIRGDDSGIGGTGLQADVGDSGLGGTGIFGTLTAFGSVCVNGLRIDYPDDAQISVNGRLADAAALAVGQVVWLVAAERDGQLETRRIAIHSAVWGRIDAIDAGRRQLRVAGRNVVVPADPRAIVVGSGQRSGFASLEIGQNVDVSGLPDGSGRVVASRVVVVAKAPSMPPGELRVADLVAGAEGVAWLSIEGYVDAQLSSDRVRVGGLEVDLSGRPNQRGRVGRGARIRATGRLAPDGSLHVERPPERPPVVTPPSRDSTLLAPAPNVDDAGPRLHDVNPAEPVDSPEPVVRPDARHQGQQERPDISRDVPRPERIERPPVIERPMIDRPVIDRPDTPGHDIRPGS